MFERFTAGARAAVVAARDEAGRLHADRVTAPHLLLGVLAGADESLRTLLAGAGLTADTLRAELAARRAGDPLGPDDAAALEAIGIDLDAVRSRLEDTFGAGVLDEAPAPEPNSRFAKLFGDAPGFGRDAKKALELALREAVVRRERSIGPEHILLGLLRGDDPATVSLIETHVPRDELRRLITGHLDAAA